MKLHVTQPLTAVAVEAHELADVATLLVAGCEENALQAAEWRGDVEGARDCTDNGMDWLGMRSLPKAPKGRTAGQHAFDHARALLRSGWPEGMARFTQKVGDLQVDLPATRSVRRRARWSDSGDDLAIERVHGGDLEHAWRRTQREEGEGATYVTLTLDWGANSNANAEELFWSGAVVTVLTDALEAAGRRVTVQLANHNRTTGGSLLAVVILKQAMEPLRMEELVAASAHAGIFRTLGFELWKVAPAYLGWGHGSHRPLTTAPLKQAATWGVIDEPGHLVNGFASGVRDLQSARRELARLLAAIDTRQAVDD